MPNSSSTFLLAVASMILSTTACVDATSEDEFSPFDEPSEPNLDSKSDEVRACGAESCAPILCGYDCTTRGTQCTASCAAADARSQAFVAATVSGPEASSFDSRQNPYAPVFTLDNVLIYGCQLWDFSNQVKDGLEIEFEELIHSSPGATPADPTRHGRKLGIYTAPFQGPGSYRAEATFQATHETPAYITRDGCSVDVASDANGGLTGSFDCALQATTGASTSVKGRFACPENAMDPIFSRWAH